MKINYQGDPFRAGEVDHEAHDFVASGGVKTGHRFVGEDQLGLLHEGTGDAHALLLATAQSVGPVPRFVGKADFGERGGCELMVGGGKQVGEACEQRAVGQSTGEHVHHDRKSGHEIEVLKHHADTPTDDTKGTGTHFDTIDKDRARSRSLQAVDGAEEGRFAGSTGSENGGHRPGFEVQRDRVGTAPFYNGRPDPKFDQRDIAQRADAIGELLPHPAKFDQGHYFNIWSRDSFSSSAILRIPSKVDAVAGTNLSRSPKPTTSIFLSTVWALRKASAIFFLSALSMSFR